MSNQSMSKHIKEIVDSVKSHLGPNREENLHYIYQEIHKYKSDPEGPNIIYYLSKLMWNYLPEEKLRKMREAVQKDLNNLPPGVSVDDLINKMRKEREDLVKKNLEKANHNNSNE